MADFKIDAVLTTDPEPGEIMYDMRIDSNGDIEAEDQLETAILVSLFSDERAAASEVVEPQSRRGWIGDLESDDRIGSKLWLLQQSRLTPTVAAKAGTTAQESLQWMVRDNIARRVAARAIAGITTLTLQIDIWKPNSAADSFEFSLWEQTGKG